MRKLFREINSSLNVNQPNITYLETPVKAYNFSLPRIYGGHQFELASNAGRVTLLCFWASTSPLSDSAVYHLDKWYRECGVANFNVVAINCDMFRPAPSFENANMTGITMLWDQEGYTQEFYEIDTFPSTILIDKNGLVRDQKAGGPINDWARLGQRVKALTGEFYG